MCSTTPRFSYGVSKRAVRALPTSTAMATAAVVYGWDGYTGWVAGRAIPGYYPPSTLKSPTQSLTAKRAPEAPAGAGVGGQGRAGWDGPCTHPPGPVGPAALPGTGPSQNPASWPIWARIDLILLKVSQKREVSPKYVNKACHSPYFKNRVQKSPLGKLRFPFLLAFSHKELLGLF